MNLTDESLVVQLAHKVSEKIHKEDNTIKHFYKKILECSMDAIEDFFNNKIILTWDIDNVLFVAKEGGYHITRDDAEQILEIIYLNYDPNIVDMWGDTTQHIHSYLKEKTNINKEKNRE